MTLGHRRRKRRIFFGGQRRDKIVVEIRQPVARLYDGDKPFVLDAVLFKRNRRAAFKFRKVSVKVFLFAVDFRDTVAVFQIHRVVGVVFYIHHLIKIAFCGRGEILIRALFNRDGLRFSVS